MCEKINVPLVYCWLQKKVLLRRQMRSQTVNYRSLGVQESSDFRFVSNCTLNFELHELWYHMVLLNAIIQVPVFSLFHSLTGGRVW